MILKLTLFPLQHRVVSEVPDLSRVADKRINFLPPPFEDVAQFCSSEVETMDRESEEIHIVALATFLQVNLQVAHLDQSQTSGQLSPLHLLPGHPISLFHHHVPPRTL